MTSKCPVNAEWMMTLTSKCHVDKEWLLQMTNHHVFSWYNALSVVVDICNIFLANIVTSLEPAILKSYSMFHLLLDLKAL